MYEIPSCRDLLDWGYRVCSVTPPHAAPLDPLSQLLEQNLGKAPGIFGPRGWRGYDIATQELSREQLIRAEEEHGTGSGVILDRLLAIDIDVTDEAWAGVVRDTAIEVFGPDLMFRVGRYPKACLLFQMPVNVSYGFVAFEVGGVEHKIEFLSGPGKHVVMRGPHRDTGKPYWLNRPPPSRPDLPEMDWHRLCLFLTLLRQRLPGVVRIRQPGGRDDLGNKLLQIDEDLLRRAISAIPNASESFPTRAEWVEIAYAIKAGLGEDGLELWLDFCDRWDGGTNDPSAAEKLYAGIHGPYRRGGQWLVELAEELGPRPGQPGCVSVAEIWFDEEVAAAARARDPVLRAHAFVEAPQGHDHDPQRAARAFVNAPLGHNPIRAAQAFLDGEIE